MRERESESKEMIQELLNPVFLLAETVIIGLLILGYKKI
jgi:hypothetical protein